MPPLTSASIQREADLAAHAPPTLRARLVRRQLPLRSEERATRQRRSDAKKRLAYRMAKRLRYPTHPSDSRSRGLPEQRLSLRSALAPFLGKANATRGHCLSGGATRQQPNVRGGHPDRVRGFKLMHTRRPTYPRVRRGASDAMAHRMPHEHPRKHAETTSTRALFFHTMLRTTCTTAHSIAGQHVVGRGRSRVRSNGAEPYLIACGVHGGASGAKSEVVGENCARRATAEGRMGGRQE